MNSNLLCYGIYALKFKSYQFAVIVLIRCTSSHLHPCADSASVEITQDMLLQSLKCSNQPPDKSYDNILAIIPLVRPIRSLSQKFSHKWLWNIYLAYYQKTDEILQVICSVIEKHWQDVFYMLCTVFMLPAWHNAKLKIRHNSCIVLPSLYHTCAFMCMRAGTANCSKRQYFL